MKQKQALKISLGVLISTVFGLVSCISPPANIADLKLGNFDKSLIQKADFKTKAVQPQLLHFDSKVPNQNFSTTQDLPLGSFNEFSLKVTGNMRNAIKIPASGNFNLVIRSGSNFQIIDNDANDGTAIVQMPQGMSEGFATITRDASGRQTGSINIKDDLYYVNQDLKELELSNKGGANNLTGDYWYQLKKRVFPLTQNWANPNGLNHVLKFSNNGIKQILFRWYNASNIDYPLGVKEIGANGGVVELSGVGRLEIPQGALNQNTIISMREELEAKEILHAYLYFRVEDFASPIIKLQPFGMQLNKKSILYLETNRERVGNNHPRALEWNQSDNKLDWQYRRRVIPDGVPRNKWTIDYPTRINNLSYFCKTFPTDVSPNDCLGGCSDNSKKFNIQSFNIKSDETQLDSIYCNINENNIPNSYSGTYFSKHFVVNSLNPDFKLIGRLEKAYDYYKEKAPNVNPLVYQDDDCKIQVNSKVIIPYEAVKAPYASIKVNDDGNFDAKNISTLNMIVGNRYGSEHELWHLFQHTKYDKSVLEKHSWIRESSAMHMGAKVFKTKSVPAGFASESEGDKTQYLNFLNKGLKDLSKSYSFPLKTVPPNTDDTFGHYYKTGFYTYLGNAIGDDKIIDALDASKNFFLDKYHDYSKHAYIGDKFDIYTDDNTKITTNDSNITLGNKISNPVSKQQTLLNNSTAYYKFSSDDKNIKGEKVSVRIYTPTSSCQNTGKVKILTYKDTSDIKTPVQEVDITNWRTIGDTNNSKSWVEIPGNFKEDYDYFVVINSNSNGKVEDDPNISCNYNIDVGIKTLIPFYGYGSTYNLIQHVYDGTPIYRQGGLPSSSLSINKDSNGRIYVHVKNDTSTIISYLPESVTSLKTGDVINFTISSETDVPNISNGYNCQDSTGKGVYEGYGSFINYYGSAVAPLNGAQFTLTVLENQITIKLVAPLINLPMYRQDNCSVLPSNTFNIFNIDSTFDIPN